MPKVSVLIPCFNVVQTLDEALSSLARQTLQDFEVVCVDDGSTDGTLNKLQEWATIDQRIRVHPLPHQGIICALNAGLDVCRSVYVARMDADDRSMPDRLARQLEMLETHSDVALVSSLVRGFPEAELGIDFRAYLAWLNGLLTGEDIMHNIFVQSPLAHPSVAFRREWVRRVGGYQDHGWAEDYDLWMRLYLNGAKFGKVPQVLLEWRDHPLRLTHTDDRYSKRSDLRLKANYLVRGPLSAHDEFMIWGTNASAYQFGEQLLLLGCPSIGYVASSNTIDRADPILPIISSLELNRRLHSKHPPKVLVADQDPVQRTLISQQLMMNGFRQGIDWWVVG